MQRERNRQETPTLTASDVPALMFATLSGVESGKLSQEKAMVIVAIANASLHAEELNRGKK
jgi:hypothetical protein